jgi:hypothetical protein
VKQRALFAVAVVYSAAHFCLSGIRQPLGNFYGDFLASFPSEQAARFTGRLDFFRGSLAQSWAGMHTGQALRLWHYGPLEHLITLPLFVFPNLRTAYTAWLIANYVFLGLIALLAADVYEWRGWGWIAFLGALNFLPLFEALTQRNIEIFELLLIFAAFAMMRRRRQVAGGFLIGLAAMTKFLPLIFLPYFAVRRMWRAFGGALLAIVPLAIATEWLLGWSHSGIVYQLRHGSFLETDLNQSLSGMVIRLIRRTRLPLDIALASQIAIVAALMVLALLFIRARHQRGDEDLAWSALITAMVLLPPHNEQYYFVLLLFPYCALLTRRMFLPWLTVSYLLVAMPVPLSLLNRLLKIDSFQTYLGLGIPFAGAAILMVLCSLALVGTSHAVYGTEQQCPWKTHSPISPPSSTA